MGILSNWLLRASWHVSYGEHSRTMSPIRRDSPANLFLDSCATNIPTKPLVTHELVYSPPSGHLSIQSGQLLYPTPAPDCNVSAVHILLVPSNCKGPSVNLIQTFSSSVICQSQKDKRGYSGRRNSLVCSGPARLQSGARYLHWMRIAAMHANRMAGGSLYCCKTNYPETEQRGFIICHGFWDSGIQVN